MTLRVMQSSLRSLKGTLTRRTGACGFSVRRDVPRWSRSRRPLPFQGMQCNVGIWYPQSASQCVRLFQNESAYHSVADETLEDIQDAVEEALEDNGIPEFEVTYASGVLTMVFPPHGTWVINKQTPNQQIWWSSPISGPRRYEYEEGEWVFTRDDSHSMTLHQALKTEVQEIYQIDLEL